MPSDVVLNLVKNALKAGRSEEDITKMMKNTGYGDSEIAEVMAAIKAEQSNTAQQPRLTASSQTSSYSMQQTPKSNSLTVITIILFIVLGGVAFYFLFIGGSTILTGGKVCTTMGCLIAAAQNCTPARMDYSMIAARAVDKLTTPVYLEIKGGDAEQCLLYMRSGKPNVEVSDSQKQQLLSGTLGIRYKSEEDIDAMTSARNNLYAKVSGLDATCNLTTNELTGFLNNITTVTNVFPEYSHGSICGRGETQYYMTGDPRYVENGVTCVYLPLSTCNGPLIDEMWPMQPEKPIPLYDYKILDVYENWTTRTCEKIAIKNTGSLSIPAGLVFEITGSDISVLEITVDKAISPGETVNFSLSPLMNCSSATYYLKPSTTKSTVSVPNFSHTQIFSCCG